MEEELVSPSPLAMELSPLVMEEVSLLAMEVSPLVMEEVSQLAMGEVSLMLVIEEEVVSPSPLAMEVSPLAVGWTCWCFCGMSKADLCPYMTKETKQSFQFSE